MYSRSMNMHAAIADAASFLALCQSRKGGFGGSSGQPPHLAPTYAAVAAAVTLGREALEVINRPAMAEFLQGCCVDPEAGGGFEVCSGTPHPLDCILQGQSL